MNSHHDELDVNRNSGLTVADPGFPVRGGRPPHRRMPTPGAAIFCKICMSKGKNRDPWGGGQWLTPSASGRHVGFVDALHVTHRYSYVDVPRIQRGLHGLYKRENKQNDLYIAIPIKSRSLHC